jgi:tetratricopeptide (TPR) repeat protein
MFKKATPPPVVVDPNDISPVTAADFTARGWLYFGRQDYSKAAADLQQALTQNANDPDTLYALGMTLAATNQQKEAIEVFERALASLTTLEDAVRIRMLTRLIKGHISRIKTGDWHLTR